jgi:hypothetical protein
LKLALASLWGDTLHQLNRVIGLQDLCLKLTHPTVKPEYWRLADDDVDVASPLLDCRLKQLIDENGGHGLRVG